MCRELKDVGEWGLLKWLYEKIGKHFGTKENVMVGVGDDAAVIDLGDGVKFAITMDALVEGVHFELSYVMPSELGWKALSVNLSDMAAMFAKPLAAFVTLALPSDTTFLWVRQLYRGMIELSNKFDVAILGGDTSRSNGGIFISACVIGKCGEKLPTRNAATPGELIIVTGTLGDSALGLLSLQKLGRKAAMRSEALKWLVKRHLQPMPRLNEGLTALATGLYGCAIDLSDGLASDLRRVAEMSSVRMCVWLDRLPMSTQAMQACKLFNRSPIEMALTGGEDYELVITASPDRAYELCEAIERACGTRCSIIGRVERGGPDVYGVDERGKHLELVGGYEHFKS